MTEQGGLRACVCGTDEHTPLKRIHYTALLQS